MSLESFQWLLITKGNPNLYSDLLFSPINWYILRCHTFYQSYKKAPASLIWFLLFLELSDLRFITSKVTVWSQINDQIAYLLKKINSWYPDIYYRTIMEVVIKIIILVDIGLSAFFGT